jgi:lipoprotein-releasing system ATP-binding protein
MKSIFLTYNYLKQPHKNCGPIMNKNMLIAHKITKTYTQGTTPITVLHTIDITFAQGTTYAITGLSGAGKSTLIHLIAGLDTPTSGTVFFNEQNINTLSSSDHAHFLNTKIGLVFQSPYLIGELSVIENVMLPGLIAGRTHQATKQQAHELLIKVGLDHKTDSAIGELSGGQQQRIALARALINKPAFLIADEPTGNLDSVTGKAIIELILECQQAWHMGVIISSHDAYATQRMNKSYQLTDGRLTKL